MGYPRRTADLVTQNNIFVDISNDRVGIGTDQPTVKLDVVGNAAISGNLNVAGVLTYEDVTNVDAVGLITARSGLIVSGVSTFQDNVNLGDNDILRLGDDGDLQIFHDAINSYIRDLGTGILRIETDGSSIGLRKTSGESMGVFNTDGSVDLYYDNSKKFETTNNGVSVTGTITATDFNSTSDIIRKKNLREVVNSLEILKDIRGVRFDWIENGSPSVGVIAQEVEQVLPELVNENNGIKSVNYNGLVGVLIEAVKELQAEVEGLKRTR